MAQEVIIEFSGGKATITTKGFRGKACQDATRELKRLMGVTASETPTAEMSLPPVKQNLKAGA